MEVDVPGLAPRQDEAAVSRMLALARANRTIAVSFATEAGHFQRASLPTFVCGPGSIEQAHKPDEFLAESQLVECLNFLARVANSLEI